MSESATNNAPDQEIVRVVTDVRRLALQYSGDTRSKAALDSLHGRWLQPTAVVSVLGPPSSGKTTALNAAICRDLLPTDSQTLTSAVVEVRLGTAFSAVAQIRTKSGILEVPIKERDLNTYLTVQGEREVQTRHGRGAMVMLVSVEVLATGLDENLVLLDTPGTGGLRQGHLYSAQAGLVRSDAALLLSRPDMPISKSERLLMADIVERVSACILVFTHRDVQGDKSVDEAMKDEFALLCDEEQWTAILNDPIRAKVVAERFRSTPALSISATNWLAAQNLPAGSERTHLEDASNVATLFELLQAEVLTPIGTIHRKNLLLLADLLVADVESRVAHNRDLLLGVEEAIRRQAAREQASDRWAANHGQAWMDILKSRATSLKVHLQDVGKQRAEALDQRYKTALVPMTDEDREDALARIEAEPDVVFAEMLRDSGTRLDAALGDLEQLLDEEDLGEALERLIATRAVQARLTAPRRATVARKIALTPNDYRAMISGAMFGFGVTGALVAGTALTFGLLPVVIGVASGATLFGGLSKLQSRHNQDVAVALNQLTKVCSYIRNDITKAVVDSVEPAVATLADDIRKALADQHADIQAFRQANQSAQVGSEEQRNARLTEYAQVTAHCAALRESIQICRASLTR